VEEGRVAIAEVVRPRGVRGEVLAEPLSSFPERYAALERVLVGSRELRVEKLWWHDRRLVLKLAGVDSPEQAESLRGALVEVPEAERWPLPAGRYYESDLVGCRVFAGGNREVGRVTAVEDAGEVSLLLVAWPGGEARIPLVPAICPRVDVAARRIEIDPPEGLLELETAGG
jgi:16S rRNA processing protein RimM